MYNKRSRTLAAIFRNSFAALVLSAGLFTAVSAQESFYYPQPQAAAFKVPAPSAPAAALRAAGYLSQAQLQIKDFPAPPAAGSAEDKADLAAVLQWQKDRTQDQCDAALAQSDESFLSFFGDVNPFPVPLPAEAAAFFKRIDKETGDANRYIKKIYQRERPFLRSPELDPCLGRVQGFSYPSGHAAVSHLFGLILSDLLPRQGSIFMRAADQGALNRVIGGVHHPSDIEAGKRLGDRLYRELRQNQAFVADTEALGRLLR
ncbi:MAG TPA: phosphatase PAP2 family protein [Elusimicrobiales bacterium]|nr:phosphatase PAP2 family protein [Elusimicrobiales bacterium]